MKPSSQLTAETQKNKSEVTKGFFFIQCSQRRNESKLGNTFLQTSRGEQPAETA